MEQGYRFIFAPYSEFGKHICPECKQQTFVRYLDTKKECLLPDEVGKCDRVDNCGYWYSPYDYMKDNNIFDDYSIYNNFERPVKDHNSYNILSPEYLQRSLKCPANSFTAFLLKYLNNDIERLQKLINRYYLGSDGDLVVFWQIDEKQQIRTGKKMLYDEQGHRVKNFTDWMHSDFPDFKLKQCLFGLHLLNNSTKVVIITESEKTAVVLAEKFLECPEVVVMSTGGKYNLNAEKFRVFQGRDLQIICLPDCGCEEDWSKRIERMKNLNISIVDNNTYIKKVLKSDVKLKQGDDIADYFINQWKVKQIDWKAVKQKFLQWKAENQGSYK